MKCIANMTMKKVEKLPTKQTHFLSDKELQQSNVVEFNISNYRNLVENARAIEKLIKTSPFETNISVLIIKSEVNPGNDVQIQVNKLAQDYIQVDFYEKSRLAPDISFICETTHSFPNPIRTLRSKYDQKYYEKGTTEAITGKICAILQCITFFCTKLKEQESRYFVVNPLPAFALSYWKG